MVIVWPFFFFLKAYFEVAELIGVNLLAALYRHSSINLSFSSSKPILDDKNLWP